MHATTSTTVRPSRLRTRWVAGAALALVALVTLPARAQTRSASVRVNVTVLDFAVSDVIGVHGLAATAPIAAGQVDSGRRDGASWRITTGGSSAVGVRLESVGAGGTTTAPTVSLCEVAAGPSACRAEHLPATHVTSATPSSEWLLRLGESLRAEDGDGEDRIVRLTIDYVGI